MGAWPSCHGRLATGRRAGVSRVHELGRMSRPDLMGHLRSLLRSRSVATDAMSSWSNEKIIDAIVTLEREASQ